MASTASGRGGLARRLLVLAVLGCAGPAPASGPDPGGAAADPRLGVAGFLGAGQRYYSAISELMKLPGAGPDHGAALADFQLSFGMRERAEESFRASWKPGDDAASAAAMRLRVARLEYQRGYLDAARATLLRAREGLPAGFGTPWSDLYARVLMAQGRYVEAAAVLDAVDVREDPQGFLRYNLAAALIASGRVPDGRAVLERVGRLEGLDALGTALRDRANLVLGWMFLEQQLGGAARPLLLRVGSRGPYTNRALLGLGWAELLPAGEGASRAELGIEPLSGGALRTDPADPLGSRSPLGVLMRNAPLDVPADRRGRSLLLGSGDSPREQQDRLRRALSIWAELGEGDADDAAVQESWLATAFALDRLGAHTEALSRYEDAVQRLEQARLRVRAAMQALHGGRMVEGLLDPDTAPEAGWTWEARRLPDLPETVFLQSLIAEHAFAERLKNERDLRLMERQLRDWADARLPRMRDAADAPADAARLAPRPRDSSHLAPLSLRLAEHLAWTDGRARPDALPRAALALRPSGMPARFEGRPERLRALQARLDALSPPLARAREQSAEQLRQLAMAELEARQGRIDRYRIEAHFALARLYDGALPAPEQDEFEIDARGAGSRRQNRKPTFPTRVE